MDGKNIEAVVTPILDVWGSLLVSRLQSPNHLVLIWYQENMLYDGTSNTTDEMTLKISIPSGKVVETPDGYVLSNLHIKATTIEEFENAVERMMEVSIV